jgi:four helix bundle protein
MPTAGHRRLIVWNKGLSLAVRTHLLARCLPPAERFELGSQLRRAAASVPANIAEGNGRAHRREYLHFLSIARGSAAEVQTYIEMMKQLNYGDAGEVQSLIDLADEVGKMLTAMILKLSERRFR